MNRGMSNFKTLKCIKFNNTFLIINDIKMEIQAPNTPNFSKIKAKDYIHNSHYHIHICLIINSISYN